MKIGIMTYWWSQCNYGQVLQAFALQYFLRQKGHDAYVIRYNHCKERKTFSFVCRNIKDIIGRRTRKFLGIAPRVVDAEEETAREFDRFRSENMRFSSQEYTSIQDLRAHPPEADMYICGSDQIWNPDLWGSPYLNRAYFLDFGPPAIKRMAYAASMGVSSFPYLMRSRIARMLGQIDVVTVREQKSVRALQNMKVEGVRVAPDPTLLVDSSVYDHLADKANWQHEGRYCFVYLIGTISSAPVAEIKRFVESKGLEIVYCGSGSRSVWPNHKLTVEQWLAAIRSADYVVTNSFHGTVFAIMFERQYSNIAISKSFAYLSDRINGLLSILHLPERYCLTGADLSAEVVDFDMCRKQLRTIRSDVESNLMRI